MDTLTPLRSIRIQRGLPLREVARAVKTDITNLSRVERATQDCTPGLAARLVEFFGRTARFNELHVLYPQRYVRPRARSRTARPE